MIPDYETCEAIAKRARAERSLYLAELMATGLFALGRAMGAARDRLAASLRPHPALSRRTALK